MPRYDITIIGAGILGAMAAYQAQRKYPQRRVLLVDRSFAGGGATHYSVGLALPYGRTQMQRRRAALSAVAYHQLKAGHPELPIYSSRFFGISHKDKVAEVRSWFFSGNVHLAVQEELAILDAIYPDLILKQNQVILTGCQAMYAVPREITVELARRLAAQSGSECWEGSEVVGIQGSNAYHAIQFSDGREVASKRVLITIGPWLGLGFSRDMVPNAGIRNKKVVAHHLACPLSPDAPILYFFDDNAFLLPLPERREWVFSITSQEWDVIPDSNQLHILPKDREIALTILGRYCPSLVAHCTGGRVFCDAYGLGGLPVIQSVQGVPGIVIAGACGGSGFRLAPAIAQEALSLLFNK